MQRVIFEDYLTKEDVFAILRDFTATETSRFAGMYILLILFALAIFKNNYNCFVISTVALLVIFAVLIGPATAGLTKVIKAFVIEKHTFIWRDFWGAFKDNFKNAAIVGFVDCLILASAFSSLQVYPAIAIQTGSKIMYIPMVIAFSLFVVILIMNYYILKHHY